MAMLLWPISTMTYMGFARSSMSMDDLKCLKQ